MYSRVTLALGGLAGLATTGSWKFSTDAMLHFPGLRLLSMLSIGILGIIGVSGLSNYFPSIGILWICGLLLGCGAGSWSPRVSARMMERFYSWMVLVFGFTADTSHGGLSGTHGGLPVTLDLISMRCI